MASAGNGTHAHVAGELFKMMAGVNMVHVPYRGVGPALTDLLAGRCRSFSTPTAASIEYIRAGKLRALAVTTATRSEALPDIPTVGEFVPGYEASAWYGIGAPKEHASQIVEKLKRRSTRPSPTPRSGRASPTWANADPRLARRIRQAHCRRHREVGQGDPRRQHQGGVIHPGSGNPSHSMAATKKVQHVADL